MYGKVAPEGSIDLAICSSSLHCLKLYFIKFYYLWLLGLSKFPGELSEDRFFGTCVDNPDKELLEW